MKKIIAFFLCLFALVLSGCGVQTDSTLKNIMDDVKVKDNVLTSSKLNLKITVPDDTKWFDSKEIKEQIAPTMEMSDYEKSQSKGAFLAMCSGASGGKEFSVSIYAVKTNESVENFAESIKDSKVYSNVEVTSTGLTDKKFGSAVYKYNKQTMKYAGEKKNGIPDYGKFEINNDMYYIKIDNYVVTIVITDSQNQNINIEALA